MCIVRIYTVMCIVGLCMLHAAHILTPFQLAFIVMQISLSFAQETAPIVPSHAGGCSSLLQVGCFANT